MTSPDATPASVHVLGDAYGVTSEGLIINVPSASQRRLLGLTEDHLRAALATATAFGWTYHQATTFFALAQTRHRRLGALDEEGRSWLPEASEPCRMYGFQNWIAQIDDLGASQTFPTPTP